MPTASTSLTCRLPPVLVRVRYSEIHHVRSHRRGYACRPEEPGPARNGRAEASADNGYRVGAQLSYELSPLTGGEEQDRPAAIFGVTNGAGLLIVEGLASDWSVIGNGAGARTVWFEIRHP